MAVDFALGRYVTRSDGTKLYVGVRFIICPAIDNHDIVTSGGDKGAKGSVLVVIDENDKPVTNPLLWVEGEVKKVLKDGEPPQTLRNYRGYFHICALSQVKGKTVVNDITEIPVAGSRYQLVRGVRVLLADIPEHYLERKLTDEEVQGFRLPAEPIWCPRAHIIVANADDDVSDEE